jgi:hypothetical protein
MATDHYIQDIIKKHEQMHEKYIEENDLINRMINELDEIIYIDMNMDNEMNECFDNLCKIPGFRNKVKKLKIEYKVTYAFYDKFSKLKNDIIEYLKNEFSDESINERVLEDSFKKIVSSSYHYSDNQAKYRDIESYVDYSIVLPCSARGEWYESCDCVIAYDTMNMLLYNMKQQSKALYYIYDRCLGAYVAERCQICSRNICYKCKDEGAYNYDLQCYNMCITNAKKLHIKEKHAGGIIRAKRDTLRNKINILREEIEEKTYDLRLLEDELAHLNDKFKS